MQAYSNPKRANDPYALPDLEVWRDAIAEYTCRCGVYDIPAEYAAEALCPSCERSGGTIAETARKAWWYWFCFPGCMPEGDVCGPFASKADALADAREGFDDGDDDGE